MPPPAEPWSRSPEEAAEDMVAMAEVVAARGDGDDEEYRALVAEHDAAYRSQIVKYWRKKNRLRIRLAARLRSGGKVADPEACVCSFMNNDRSSMERADHQGDAALW